MKQPKTPIEKIYRLPIEIEGHHSTKLVVISGDRFIGHVGLFIEGAWSSFNQLFVDPLHRKRGVASELVELCCTIAKTCGAKQIGISIAHCNERVIPFYEKRGFRQCYMEDGCHCFTRQL